MLTAKLIRREAGEAQVTGGRPCALRLLPDPFASRASRLISCPSACVNSARLLSRLLINKVLPRRLPERVRRAVLPVDQHIGILAPQQRLPDFRRPEAQIELAVAYRHLRARGLVDPPEQRRASSRSLQRAPVDHHDLDSRNRLPAVFPVA